MSLHPIFRPYAFFCFPSALPYPGKYKFQIFVWLTELKVSLLLLTSRRGYDKSECVRTVQVYKVLSTEILFCWNWTIKKT